MINNIQTEINDLGISNVRDCSKELHYNTTHTDYMFRKSVINNHRTFIIQQPVFTYQRKRNQYLQIQLLNMIVADVQNQINNLNASSPPADNDEHPDIGTM